MQFYNRRAVLGVGAMSTAVMLSGCVTQILISSVVRHLLVKSSDRAIDKLLAPDGFYTHKISQIPIPDKFAGAAAAVAVRHYLNSNETRTRLHKQLNQAARAGAKEVAPLIATTVRRVGIKDTVDLIKTKDPVATQILVEQFGVTLVDKMAPKIGHALRQVDPEVLDVAIKKAANVDIDTLAQTIAVKANDAIFKAIAEEERAIRANPEITGDKELIRVFGKKDK